MGKVFMAINVSLVMLVGRALHREKRENGVIIGRIGAIGPIGPIDSDSFALVVSDFEF